ncbi:MAG TPA: hypothetical protein VFV99_21255 [Kofleriaceae bacterium]|nr:hypothetical protein [Kofleriaceae bacterium]
MRAHMTVHLEEAAALQAAIARGWLVDARERARWFASHDMEAPPSWQPYLDDMRYAAMRIARARDVATAGAQIGLLGRACGACHEANAATPAFQYDPPPTDDATLEAQMRRHQWAAARMWEGVVGPADAAWQDGARVMATTRLDVARTAHEKPNADVFELAERLRDQATQALTMTARDARARFYGEMMETCASCHSIVRPIARAAAR